MFLYGTVSRYIMSFDSTCFYMALRVDISCRLTPHVLIWHWVDISCRLTPHVFIWHWVDISCRLTPHDISSHSAYKNMWSQTTWYIFSQCQLHMFLYALWEDISCRLTPHVFIWHCEKIYHVVWLHMFLYGTE